MKLLQKHQFFGNIIMLCGAIILIPAYVVSYFLIKISHGTPTTSIESQDDIVLSLENKVVVIEEPGVLSSDHYRVTSEWHPEGSLASFKQTIADTIDLTSDHSPIEKSLASYCTNTPKSSTSTRTIKTDPDLLLSGTIRPYGHRYHIFLKGDLETILATVSSTESEREKALLTANQWHSKGHQTIGFCKIISDKPIEHIRDLASSRQKGELAGIIALKNRYRPDISRMLKQLLDNQVAFHIITPETTVAVRHHAKKLFGSSLDYKIIDCSIAPTLKKYDVASNYPVTTWYANATKKDIKQIKNILSGQGNIVALNDHEIGYNQLVASAKSLTYRPTIKLSKIIFYSLAISYIAVSCFITITFMVDTF